MPYWIKHDPIIYVKIKNKKFACQTQLTNTGLKSENITRPWLKLWLKEYLLERAEKCCQKMLLTFIATLYAHEIYTRNQKESQSFPTYKEYNNRLK